jgi:flap endonuclease-1
MGVKFKDIVSLKNIKFQDLDRKIVAIDAANIIYQFLSIIRQRDGTPLMDHKGRITSHLSGILYRTSSLIEKGIKPFYVFDGMPHYLKSYTITKRSEIKKDSEKKWKEAVKEGRTEDALKFATRTSRMSEDVIKGSKTLLNIMGIPYIQAKGEGEAQASYMVKKGDAWCVASQDYDCILFGSPRMLRNLASTDTRAKLELIELNKILKNLKINRKQLVDLAILVGTDFNQGIKGIGAKKGLNLIREYTNVYNVLEHLKVEIEVDPNVIRDIFLKFEVIDDYKLKWKKPDEKKVLEFLCLEHDFSEDRVTNAIKKLNKLDTTQKGLENWF